eukprot:TRINITY_DN24868_c0_g1_i1.p1 TRINITY_DN24868_c0_g1~~TRINITY_DN24868_c0_g1_i1.p1  ORF type:complete len:128 (-),score=31.71 TRINITY_DN24868_c0_g1_i1:38-421(-)
MGVHTKAPGRYSSTSHSSGYDMRTSRRSVTPGPNLSSYRPPVSSIPSSSYSSSRRNSVSLSSSNAYSSSSSSSSSRQRHYSTPPQLLMALLLPAEGFLSTEPDIRPSPTPQQKGITTTIANLIVFMK